MAVVQGLASIGIDVKINSVSMNFVTKIGDIGGTPSTLDTTCMLDTMKHSKNGVQNAGVWEVDYLFDNSDAASDYRVLRALKGQQNVPVEVKFPDNTVFKSAGEVSTYITGPGTDQIIAAKLSVALSKDWEVTDPS